jgi:phosphoribosylamine--glycine ligase/phosphoribosylformylglycinamidine cyclo-ligase
MLRIGLIGCGGRENAIGKSLIKNSNELKLYYIGNHANIGLDSIGATYENIDITNAELILKWAQKYELEFVIIGPEKPLECGVADILEENNISCLGPRKELAKLETSKIFCREFLSSLETKLEMKLNPEYYFFDSEASLREQIENGDCKFVIKQDCLAGGKGVLVMDDHFDTKEDGLQICLDYIKNGVKFHIEEKLEGDEFSLFSITDGINVQHCPPIQDYKRLLSGNNGPNTGGMGCVMNHLPFLNSADIEVARSINNAVIKNVAKYCETDYDYKGVLYGSFIKTKNGIRVIEYNCRFGDPEVISLLESMKSSFLDICVGVLKRNLNKELLFDKSPIITKYLVPDGYPSNPMKNYEFYVHKINTENVTWANCERRGEHYIQLGSRTFAYTLKGDCIEQIQKNINWELSKVQGRLNFRKDIGSFDDSKYAESGVNIETGNTIVKEIQQYIKKTENSTVMSEAGGFNGMLRLGEHILVSSMDGVGTKSIFIKDVLGEDGLEFLGMDLVSHCINDILVSGAEPLFFLDYFASSKLSCKEVVNFVKGISKICSEYNIILAGGETAEMPEVYNGHHCDLVGTIVGTVTESTILRSSKNVKKGDIVIGLRADGLHTNGFSLLRKLLIIGEEKGLNPSKEVMRRLCQTHKCYLNDIKNIQKKANINGLCHITGGGLIDNPPRVLPKNMRLEIDNDLLFQDPIYDWIKSLNYVSEEEMMRVFNCGFGMLIFISPDEAEKLGDNDEYVVLGKVTDLQ